jgi:D-glycero-alpha-D-manno-heptose-7-phosphate kinase
MIITKTPFRVSLFGGGTDHPAWYLENGGSVLSFTIDKYSYISLRELPPFFEHKFRVSYSINELVSRNSEIKHPAVREAFKKFAPELNLELLHHGDLPARSGIGSSSAFSVGLINSIYALKGVKILPDELANLAIEFEQKILKENVGSQDQIACSLGGINFIEFGPGPYWQSESLSLPIDYINRIEQSMVLVYTGVSRMSSDVSLGLLSDLSSKANEMKRNIDLALECKKVFQNESELSVIGQMLDESWNIKQRINPKSVNSVLQNIYAKAMNSGALGGKILGAGGGGFFLFWVNPEFRDSFIQKMGDFITVPVRIVNHGSKIIQ